jgi:SpoVK/Ycf46/Vps4 family AAA+-type ATPase
VSSSAGGLAQAQPQPPATPAAQPFANGTEHLLAGFERLRLMLLREVLRLRAAHLLNENEFRGLYISDEQVDSILKSRPAPPAGAAALTDFPGTRQISIEIHRAEQFLATRVQATLAEDVELPLVRLAKLFGLGPQEQDALLICVAPEIDLCFETLYSYAQNDVTRKRPTPDLVLRLLSQTQGEKIARRSLFSPEGPLLQGPLIRLADEAQDREGSFLARPLRSEERIVDFLLEHEGLDARLRSFATIAAPTRKLTELYFPATLAQALRNAEGQLTATRGTIFLQGPSGSGKRAVAEAFSTASARPLLAVDLRCVSNSAAPVSTILPTLRREATLLGANLLLAHAESLVSDDPSSRTQRTQWEAALHSFPFTVFIGSEVPWPTSHAEARSHWSAFELPVPLAAHRAQLWQQAIQNVGSDFPTNLDLTALANRFALTGGEIENACQAAQTRASLRPPVERTISLDDLEAAARAGSSHGLNRLAQKAKLLHDWNDLILAPRFLRQLREVCAAEKYRHQIYSDWGFDQRLAQGKGLNVLFSGTSGTGKTMSAGIIARELSLDLYKIDLSTVVSKYIGETEKQLSQIFREARSSNAILFFDEADALFGKRSEVKDAHDRYANVEVAYLLQKMEEYEGIVILATNFRKNMDEAFTRRLHYVVDFPFPDAESREKIWKSFIPSKAPLADDIDFSFLARQFELAGGNIRNVALSAAFLAAEQGSPIRMEHFIRATSRELQKMGKLPTRSEFRDFYDLIREPVERSTQ